MKIVGRIDIAYRVGLLNRRSNAKKRIFCTYKAGLIAEKYAIGIHRIGTANKFTTLILLH